MGSCSSKQRPRVRGEDDVGENDRTTIRVNYYKRPGIKLHPRDHIALCSLLLHLREKHESFVLSCHIDQQNGRILWLYDDLIPPLASVFLSYPFNRAVDFETRDLDCVRRDFLHVGSKNFRLGDSDTDHYQYTIGFPFLFAIILSEPSVAYDFLSWMENKTVPFCTFLCFKPRLDVDEEKIKTTLGVLGNLDRAFAKRLRQLSFIGNFETMNEAHLYTLFAKILPTLPDLEKLSLADVDLGALRAMLHRMNEVDPLLESQDRGAATKKNGPVARELLLEDLKLFRTIDSLWSSCRDKDNVSASLPRNVDLHRALTTERASVAHKSSSDDSLITERTSMTSTVDYDDEAITIGDPYHGIDTDTDTVTNHNPQRRYRVSAWPIVLKRVVRLENDEQRILIDKRDMVAAMYHVLREGPVLLPRCNLMDGNPSPERMKRRLAQARAERRKERRARNLEFFLKIIGFIDWNESLASAPSNPP